MELLSLIIAMSAALFVFRIMRLEFCFEQTQLTKIGTLFVVVGITSCLVFQNVAFNICFASACLVLSFQLRRLETALVLVKVESWLIAIMSELLLSLRSGTSLRVAFEQIIHAQKHPLKRKWLQLILDHVTFLQQRAPEIPAQLLPLIEVLSRCEANPHLQIKLLENFRWITLRKFEFRQRSNQALIQLKIQSRVLLILFIGLSILSNNLFGWNRLQPFLLISAPLIGIGLIVNLYIRRSFRWKI